MLLSAAIYSILKGILKKNRIVAGSRRNRISKYLKQGYVHRLRKINHCTNTNSFTHIVQLFYDIYYILFLFLKKAAL